MSTSAKTVIATGASSGLGFESVKQLLEKSEPYNFILGARNTEKVQAAYNDLGYDTTKHSVTIIPLDLLSLRSVQLFVQQALSKLGPNRIDFLYLAAGTLDSAEGPGPHGSQWCAGYVVNHLSQHYLVHLLREALLASKTRLVFVSSGAIRNVRDQNPSTLDVDMKANSGAGIGTIYSGSKFIQLLGAHYWRRNLVGCTIVAVSPGLVPGTNLATDLGLSMSMPDAKTVPEGAQNLLRAFTVSDIPTDPEQIFLTSWGEWWPTDVYALSLDTKLQDKWCISLEEIESEEGLSK
ncbi:short-chain dehydrogenases/reductase [Penicillium verhagenii]|uniref:short-chain dehydrogenases/reductase n=1 Tax=Penicillium verhagenii TaxID=1562060 RepID=UPI00254524A4|nr:short-chain dehydrogenases/reductase [Penicillium verhagenii]KAJ5947687.1 short-chain dehydrogenases/reductase [Penicillium verhagenii]